MVGTIVFAPIVGFFFTGTSANIPAGSGVKAFLDEDLRIAGAQPAPVTVQQPAAEPIKVLSVKVPGNSLALDERSEARSIAKGCAFVRRRDMPQLTFEAVALRHCNQFDR